MRIRLTLLAICALLLVPGAAHASLADEQRQGQDLIAQLPAGTRTCGDLSAEDFDHIGEYVMSQALGSTSLHQAMNDRMTQMMGARSESRMHELLGQRYAGCNVAAGAASGYGGMMGSGMMGGYYDNGGVGAMMGSGEWSWMMRGAWQNMTRRDWQRVQQQLLGTSTTSSGGRWSPLAIIAATLGVVALAALAMVVVIRPHFRRPPDAAASRE
jgi:hypothetical protein